MGIGTLRRHYELKETKKEAKAEDKKEAKVEELEKEKTAKAKKGK